MKTPLALILTLTAALTSACATTAPTTDLLPGETRRTPAEWEPQAAVWLQWPRADFEDAGMERAFADIVRVIAQYETVQLLAADSATQQRGEAALQGIDGDIRWHQMPVASSWMRDNGPRYVELDGQMVLQNWEFDGYHDGRDESLWVDDNGNPDDVAALLDMPLEQVGLVHERGDLEVNGSDTAMVNWSVVGHRNPGVTRDEATAIFQETLGVSRVIYLEGFHPEDVTRGHTDGLARFIAEDAVVVPRDGSALFDTVASQIAEQAPDLTVHRLELLDNDPTLNWLVGDGFVLTGSVGDAQADAEIAIDLRGYFPGREIHFVDVGPVWENGGGVHCVTNDQPESPQ